MGSGGAGALDIADDPTIKSSGATATLIDGGTLDRAIQVLHGAANVSGVPLRNEPATTGGDPVDRGGRATLSSVEITGNRAIGSDGANFAPGNASTTTGDDASGTSLA